MKCESHDQKVGRNRGARSKILKRPNVSVNNFKKGLILTNERRKLAGLVIRKGQMATLWRNRLSKGCVWCEIWQEEFSSFFFSERVLCEKNILAIGQIFVGFLIALISNGSSWRMGKHILFVFHKLISFGTFLKGCFPNQMFVIEEYCHKRNFMAK